ncbi:dihydroxy-acid dehydratase family protein [Alphaproteobacteria bacterium]|jgi:dihydroxy-acid dehydratase|nr:dihydroxy-acid dehydratase family protein [Alphaproteobacteria bacterium]MDA9816739.1 dihydroxy-acid dehydratase family protein [Alphaproteobacteria bacterium]MDB2583970.1 dihydroxy-acid dehydratase family protein [Alphaproteobacteria bacterium]MDB2683315.1 dihydroxy-acid dehydratase family protein [Alphaproteobacteria bacterium]
MSGKKFNPKYRSQQWFDNPTNPGMTALYLERSMNFGLTPDELRSGKPIIGIAQTGSDISPCNRVHIKLAERVREGIRAAGGIAFEFPVHPIQETLKRPTAAVDRNLAYLGLVEILHGYPLDGVVLMTGCDKTTPSCLMAAATVDLPAIVLNGGPMLDGWHNGKLAGSGTAVWDSRVELAAGRIDYEQFIDIVTSSAPSDGHCNTMGTASTMNSLAEALGMSLTGNANIPAPYRERGQMAYKTGLRIVELVKEDLTPSQVMTRKAFENAIVVNSAIGGSTNAQIHITAIARHVGVELETDAWQQVGYDIPLMANIQPAGEYLCESYHRAGGTAAIMSELLANDKIHGDVLTVTGKRMSDNLKGITIKDEKVITPFNKPMKQKAGFVVLKGNLFDAAIMKTSVISKSFKDKFLSRPGKEGILEGNVIVFEGSEDYHDRLNDKSLNMNENSILVIRGAGPVGWPGSAEVVNMQPSDDLIKQGITELPCIGDGRQSGTSGSPSILNASPESATGGGLAWLRTGDKVVIDLNNCTANMIVSDSEIEERKKDGVPVYPKSQTPWQEIQRNYVGELSGGGVLENAVKYQKVKNSLPRDNH